MNITTKNIVRGLSITVTITDSNSKISYDVDRHEVQGNPGLYMQFVDAAAHLHELQNGEGIMDFVKRVITGQLNVAQQRELAEELTEAANS